MNLPVTAPLVSIIVPIYKVEAYLEQCIESLLAQTYENIEIILVDDGSPDGCGAICDKYAAKDSRVTALHKSNGGLSDARNYGLKHARGELISFVDSDDWVSPIFIEALQSAMEMHGARLSTVTYGHSFHDGDYFLLLDDISAAKPLMKTLLSPHEALQLMLYQAMGTGAVWSLYERSVLGDDPFPIGIYYEDLASTYKFVHRAGGVALVDSRELYAYRLRETSIIRQNYRPIKARSALVVADQLYRDIAGWYPDLDDAAASRCFSVCRMVYAQIPTGAGATGITKHDRDELWAVLSRHRATVACDRRARKRERLAAGIACLGRGPFDLFCRAARKAGLLQ